MARLHCNHIIPACAPRADRCQIDRIVRESNWEAACAQPLEEMQEVSRYASGHNTQMRMPSFCATVWKFSGGPAGPGSLDGYQGNTELHGVHTEFHGVGRIALRAEPALARSAQTFFLRETPCELRATPCSLEVLAARGTEQPVE